MDELREERGLLAEGRHEDFVRGACHGRRIARGRGEVYRSGRV
jgi:hypothetical protein